MRISHSQGLVLVGIVVVLAISNVILDVWLWFRIASYSNAPGSVRRLVALLATSVSSITYTITPWVFARPGAPPLFNSRAARLHLYVLIGFMPAVIGVVAGCLALAKESGRRIAVWTMMSALLAGFLWFVSIVATSMAWR